MIEIWMIFFYLHVLPIAYSFERMSDTFCNKNIYITHNRSSVGLIIILLKIVFDSADELCFIWINIFIAGY